MITTVVTKSDGSTFKFEADSASEVREVMSLFVEAPAKAKTPKLEKPVKTKFKAKKVTKILQRWTNAELKLVSETVKSHRLAPGKYDHDAIIAVLLPSMKHRTKSSIVNRVYDFVAAFDGKKANSGTTSRFIGSDAAQAVSRPSSAWLSTPKEA